MPVCIASGHRHWTLSYMACILRRKAQQKLTGYSRNFVILLTIKRHKDVVIFLPMYCMPVHKGKDSKGPYYQWGKHGKKYRGRDAAKKAARQGRAAYAHGYRG
jgi:hypothetical protein